MNKSHGFTLIELMIAVAIVGILAAIAVPAFTEQMRKSRRSEAMQCLSDMQLRQERWRSNHTTYGTTANIGAAASSFYTCAVTANSATGYTMTATPTAGAAQVGDRCGTYQLQNNAGAITKSAGATDCWGT